MAIDGLTAWILADGHTDEVGSGISNITNTGSSLIFTLTAGGTLTVPITGLSDQNFTTVLKNKLNSLDSTVLNLFTYSSGTLYFNGDAIAKASSVTSVANSLNTLDTTTTNHINNTANPHSTKIGNLNDAKITSPVGGQLLSYNASTKQWINADPSASSKDEKVKLNASSDANYLDALVDNSTIEILNDKLVAISLNGLSATVTELNTLTGMTSNVKTTLDTLASAGMSYKGTVTTKASLLSLTGMVTGNVRIVLADESNSGKRITYIFDGTTWQSLGEFSITVRDFSTNPIDLSSEITGTLAISHVDISTLLAKTDVVDNVTSTNVDKPLSANQGKVLKSTIDSKQNAIYVQGTMPTGTLILNDIWLDNTDSSNVIMYYYNGTSFIKVGKSGVSINEWAGSTNYTVGVYVTYNSLLYKCIIAHTSGASFDPLKFTLIGGDVVTTTAQTLTNKSLVDSTTFLIDEIDATKKAKFEASGITTGTTRILTIPDKSGTLTLNPSTTNYNTVTTATLVNNTLYEISSSNVASSLFTLPTGSSLTDKIEILVSCSGFVEGITFFNVVGNINGIASNTVQIAKNYFKCGFSWSVANSTWIYFEYGQGH
jgi:hypothetical protein